MPPSTAVLSALPAASSDLERFLRIMAEEGTVGILSFDAATGQCRFINRVAREALEVTWTGSDALIDLNLSELFCSEQKPGFGHALSREMVMAGGYNQDIYFLRKNGNAIFVNLEIHLVQGEPVGNGSNHALETRTGSGDALQSHAGAGAGTIFFAFQDITLQKKLQRDLQMKQDQIRLAYTELLEQNKQLLELDQAKDRFIALTTHELRTPLSAIVATTEVLVMGFEESPEQHTEFIKTVHEQSLHLMDLINDILDFAKIRAGKMEYFVEELDLRDLLKQVGDGFQKMAEQAGLKMQIEMPELAMSAYADQLRIREVIGNVVSNAIKYNRAGGRVRVSVNSVGACARITVADDGMGIAEDQISHVFNEFETLGNVSRHHKGTGLGMPISKKLIEAMGGKLWLTSVVGTGTEFHIEIPMERVLNEELYRPRPDSWGDFAA